MKIALADNCGLKFCKDIMEHWITQGHEVKYERGASEHLAQWADVYYVDWVDNNIRFLYDLYHDDPQGCRTENWNNNKKPMIVCRAIDWDVWTGFGRNQDIIDWVDKWICIAPHIEKKLRAEAHFEEGKLRLIRPGVNLKKFPLKTKKTDGCQLGMVLGDMWWPKNHMGGLDIFTTLYKQNNQWRLHIRGQHEGGDYWKIMYEHYLESRGIREAVTLYDSIEDINAFYEEIDILLHPGMKEAYCYAVAEAMAKGIPVVVNDFYGSYNIWPDYILYTTHAHAIHKINRIQGDVMKYGMGNISGRLYIKKNYNIEQMCVEYDEFLGL